MVYLDDNKMLLRKACTRLLEIKDIDIRLLSLHQCRHAVDSSIHIGGAFSATIPMVSLFYGGYIHLNVEAPTKAGQDIFVLSKGHAVATLASIYADLGYFPASVLENSRSVRSILNGHPGPLLPGVHVATGPMGQGVGVAQGLALAGRRSPEFDVFALTGDGELQEGPVWEAVMFAAQKRLENLCVMVDKNNGQLDTVTNLHFPHNNLAASFASFGWRVLDVDATHYGSVMEALDTFKHGIRDGRPTVIICNATKGFGGFSDQMNQHKATLSKDILLQEELLQQQLRTEREQSFFALYRQSGNAAALLESYAKRAGLQIDSDGKVQPLHTPVRTVKAPVRNKYIPFRTEALPRLEKGKLYGAHKVVEGAMKEYARDQRVVSVDSDLASTSGLQAGVGYVDKDRALNAGVAEANMMLIGEAFAVLGANVWVSTFCPFYDWKVLRRIAVGHQERLEVIAEANGWLSEGHALDYTMLATAADLETQSNGATHMGNDDALLLNEAAFVKIINASCPQQLLGIIKWIMEGNRGIIYLRILRAPSEVIYPADFVFEFGKAYTVRESARPHACIVSSGRGIYEALEAAEQLAGLGYEVKVVDMPSIDKETILDLYNAPFKTYVVEQNNGYIANNIRKVLFEKQNTIETGRFVMLNTVKDGQLHYIHSGTYNELAESFGLKGNQIAAFIANDIP